MLETIEPPPKNLGKYSDQYDRLPKGPLLLSKQSKAGTSVGFSTLKKHQPPP